MQIQENTVQVAEHIDALDLNPENYSTQKTDQIKVANITGNQVFYKSLSFNASVAIRFSTSTNCHVFLGENFKGDINIKFGDSNCLVYIGNNVSLKHLDVRLAASGSRLFVGNEVSTSGENHWVLSSRSEHKDVIVGDDCMFSSEISMLSSDAHPIFDVNTWQIQNGPKSNLVIGQHCWIGRKSSILKGVNLGGCSIVSMGAVVTKSAPPFSNVRGVPAQAHSMEGQVWSRGPGLVGQQGAHRYLKKFAKEGTFTEPHKSS